MKKSKGFTLIEVAIVLAIFFMAFMIFYGRTVEHKESGAKEIVKEQLYENNTDNKTDTTGFKDR